MKVPFLDLRRQHERILPEMERALARVLQSGRFILGGELEAFESELATYLGARHAVGVGSGTDALQLALRACGVGPGDRVITSPLTAVPTVCAIVQAGATPVFVDVDETTLTIDPDRLADYLRDNAGPDVKAVIPVHLYGHPADMGAILEIARRFELSVIEDAAQAMGATCCGKMAGTLGDLGCFSFYPTKNLGACGDAGMVVTDDDELAERVRLSRNYGERSKNESATFGINSRLDEMQAAILRAKLPNLDRWNERRRILAEIYHGLLGETSLVLPTQKPECSHVYHLYVVRSRMRDALRAYLASRDIDTSIHYPKPVHLQEAYAELGYGRGAFPASERACSEIVSLPLNPELDEDAVRHVGREICEWCRASSTGRDA